LWFGFVTAIATAERVRPNVSTGARCGGAKRCTIRRRQRRANEGAPRETKPQNGVAETTNDRVSEGWARGDRPVIVTS